MGYACFTLSDSLRRCFMGYTCFTPIDPLEASRRVGSRYPHLAKSSRTGAPRASYVANARPHVSAHIAPDCPVDSPILREAPSRSATHPPCRTADRLILSETRALQSLVWRRRVISVAWTRVQVDFTISDRHKGLISSFVQRGVALPVSPGRLETFRGGTDYAYDSYTRVTACRICFDFRGLPAADIGDPKGVRAALVINPRSYP